ncbi:MAG: hypothetical protein V4563_07595 [Pseudomonadota bacterium]
MATGTYKQVSSLEQHISSERDYVRSLCADYSKETSDLERYVLTLAGVIWSWCIANSTAVGIKVLFFLPVFTTALFGLRALGVYRIRKKAVGYLSRLPKSKNVLPALVWETNGSKDETLRETTAIAFWLILQLTTILVGVASLIMLP